MLSTHSYGKESTRAMQTIRTVGFLQQLSAIDDVKKYRGWYRGIFEMVYYHRAFPNTAHP